jgi:Zn-dependent protease with chaperone function
MRDRGTLSAAAAAATTCALGLLAATAGASALAILVVAVAVVTAAAFLRHAVAHHRLVRALLGHSDEATMAGVPVRSTSLRRSAFVAGLARPVIFCDTSLSGELTPSELRAVTLHERAHQLSRDPLRMTAVAAVAPALRRTTTGRRWLETFAARREIAADRYVLQHGVPASAIASALTKVSPAGPAHVPGFSPAVDLRLRALLGDDVETSSPRRWRWIASGVALATAACVAVLDHAFHAASFCC